MQCSVALKSMIIWALYPRKANITRALLQEKGENAIKKESGLLTNQKITKIALPKKSCSHCTFPILPFTFAVKGTKLFPSTLGRSLFLTALKRIKIGIKLPITPWIIVVSRQKNRFWLEFWIPEDSGTEWFTVKMATEKCTILNVQF